MCAYVMNHLPGILTAQTPSTLSTSWELFLQTVDVFPQEEKKSSFLENAEAFAL